MSDSLAIAAVTATIRNLLFLGVSADVAGADVTAKPPDKVRAGNQGNRVNVFLYQTSMDAAWRNEDMPGQVLPGEVGHPPLALNLYYLITAYGLDDDELLAHRLLGRAMAVLHDHPLLGADEINAALTESDLDQQVERVRITPQPMTVEEMSKLWTTFQTQYRMSAAYQARVVLIESRLPVRTAPPVLARGDAGDVGVLVRPTLLLPIPTIDGLVLPNEQASALLGDRVVLTGHDLGGLDSIVVEHRRMDAPFTIGLAPDDVTEASVEWSLPNDPADLPAGFSIVRGLPADPDADPGTNEVALAIAPEITDVAATRDAVGVATVTVECLPEVVEGQQVLLLLSDRALTPVAFNAPTTTLEFKSKTLPADEYLLRLRVDGVDSLLVDRSVVPPVYDATQKVTVP
jgi:hypothetical protein